MFQMGLALQSVPPGTAAEQGHTHSRPWLGPQPCSTGLHCKGAQFSLSAFKSLPSACENLVCATLIPHLTFLLWAKQGHTCQHTLPAKEKNLGAQQPPHSPLDQGQMSQHKTITAASSPEKKAESAALRWQREVSCSLAVGESLFFLLGLPWPGRSTRH